MIDVIILSLPHHCPLVSYIPLSKNKIDDRARGREVATAGGDKAPLAVGEIG